jgi:hypothetical protein
VLRKKLNIDFAVLLMQSSHNALDQLDCVAMDQFQRDFFLLVSDHLECLLLTIENEYVYVSNLLYLSILVSLYSIRGKLNMSHTLRL